jgi:hypothetical protein
MKYHPNMWSTIKKLELSSHPLICVVGFQVDRIVDQFLQLIYAHDLTAVREFWSHLHTRMFSKLEKEFTSCKLLLISLI